MMELTSTRHLRRGGLSIMSFLASAGSSRSRLTGAVHWGAVWVCVSGLQTGCQRPCFPFHNSCCALHCHVPALMKLSTVNDKLQNLVRNCVPLHISKSASKIHISEEEERGGFNFFLKIRLVPFWEKNILFSHFTKKEQQTEQLHSPWTQHFSYVFLAWTKTWKTWIAWQGEQEEGTELWSKWFRIIKFLTDSRISTLRESTDSATSMWVCWDPEFSRKLPVKWNGGGFFLLLAGKCSAPSPLLLIDQTYYTLSHKETITQRFRGPALRQNHQSQTLPPSVDPIKIWAFTPNACSPAQTKRVLICLGGKGHSIRRRKLFEQENNSVPQSDWVSQCFVLW